MSAVQLCIVETKVRVSVMEQIHESAVNLDISLFEGDDVGAAVFAEQLVLLGTAVRDALRLKKTGRVKA